jgi:hypothetical protein
MYLQMDPLYNLQGARTIQTGRETLIELYQHRQFGFTDDPDCESGCGLVPTPTRTCSDGPEPLLTLGMVAKIYVQHRRNLALKTSKRQP